MFFYASRNDFQHVFPEGFFGVLELRFEAAGCIGQLLLCHHDLGGTSAIKIKIFDVLFCIALGLH